VHAVGVDRIVPETGLGKMTLYRGFGSKDELVAAWLRRRREQWWAAVEQSETGERGPLDRMLALVDSVEADACQSRYRGCAFLRTSAEYPDAAHPVRRICAEHVRSIRAYIAELARQAGAAEPDVLADQLIVVLEGMLASSTVLGTADPARNGAALARTLIASHRAGRPAE
jgi:AcrR family transcriptional regulator